MVSRIATFLIGLVYTPWADTLTVTTLTKLSWPGPHNLVTVAWGWYYFLLPCNIQLHRQVLQFWTYSVWVRYSFSRHCCIRHWKKVPPMRHQVELIGSRRAIIGFPSKKCPGISTAIPSLSAKLIGTKGWLFHLCEGNCSIWLIKQCA